MVKRIRKGVEHSFRTQTCSLSRDTNQIESITENWNAPFHHSADQYVIHATPVGLLTMTVFVVATNYLGDNDQLL
jgi:hypothetical protein